MALEVYWGSGSPYAWRVLLALEHKRLPYLSHLLQFSKQEHKSPQFLKMNFRGQVPVIKDGDYVCFESLAILYYLDLKYPARPIFGHNPEESGTIMRVICEYQSYAEIEINKIVGAIFDGTVDPRSEATTHAMHLVGGEARTIEQRLAKSEWVVGDEFSAADMVASGMLVANALNPSAINIFNRGPAPGFAEGFTLAAADGGSNCDANQADAASCLIARLGVRRADPNFYFGFTVVEFGVSLTKTYQHISNLVIDLFLDTNKDGVDDVDLEAADWKSLDPTNGTEGTYVTAQFDSTGAGFLDWIVGGWDYNDRVAVLPFTDTTSGGLVPASFNYRLVVTNRQGVSDTQTGTIDLARELKPDLNSFGIFRGQSAHINVTGGNGRMLWLFPTNTTQRQDDTVSIHTAHD